MPLARRAGKASCRRGDPYPEAGRPANTRGSRIIRCGRGDPQSVRAQGCAPLAALPAFLESMMPQEPSPVQLLICMTCKRGLPADPGAPRPGAVLLALIEATTLPEGVASRGVECLSNCNRGCTVALRGAGRWSYVYGDIEPVLHLNALLDGAARYRAAPDGLIPWRERPEILRKGVIARIPPLERI